MTATATVVTQRRSAWKNADLHLLIAAILLVNLPLWLGDSAAARFAFLPGPVAQGEWWRVFTHLFAHVSCYHLLLDAGAFLMLYRGLQDVPVGGRLGLCAGAAAGSLALASLSPSFVLQGLCGLSGTAHGLMAVSGLLTARSDDPVQRRVGWFLSASVLAKVLFEACTGRVLFLELHFGNIGLPNPLCHLGGVLGALSAWGVSRLTGTVRDTRTKPGMAVAA